MWQNNTYANTHTTTDKTEISYGQIPYRYAVISVTHWILVLLGSAFHSEYALLTFAKYRRKGKARRLAIYGGCTIDVEYFISINGKRLCSPILCHLMASGFSSCFTVVLYIRTCFWKILSRRKCKFQFAHVYIYACTQGDYSQPDNSIIFRDTDERVTFPSRIWTTYT